MTDAHKQYAYLSIDQLRKTYNPRNITEKHSLSEFFNIKFDSNIPLKSNDQKSKHFQEFRRTYKSNSLENSCLFGKFKESEERRLYYSSNPKTKKLNTEKMLESITKKLQKQSFGKINKRDGSQKKVVKVVYSQHQSPSFSPFRNEAEDLSIGNTGPPSIRKPLFQKMLKKCDKLKEIYRYQNELINIKNVEENHRQKIGIRFHTQPLGIFNDPEKCELLSRFKKSEYSKKVAKLKLNSIKSQDLLDDNPRKNSLQIRRYKNESVLKQRLKYIMKKQIMKNDNYNGKILRNDRWRSKIQTTKRKTKEKEEKVQVGPWDEQDELFELEFK